MTGEELRERIERRLHQDHCSMWTADGGPCFACKAKAKAILALLPTEREPVAWQKCPVCSGRGEVPGDFYRTYTTTAWETQCRTCKGSGVVRTTPQESAEVKRLRSALEELFPVEEGFTEAFDDLLRLGLIVPVPADEAFREEWGSDEETMYVWAWSDLARAALNTETDG